MEGSGFLYIYDFDVLFKGEGSVSFGPNEQLASCTFMGTGFLVANLTTDYGRPFFPALVCQGFDEGVDGYGACSASFPAMTGWGEETAFIPAEPETGFAFFPGMFGAGVTIASSPGSGNATFPAMLGQGGEGDYGHADVEFPAMIAFGADDFAPGYAYVIENMIVMTGALSITDHIVFFTTSGTIAGTITAAAEAVESVINSMQLTGSITTISELIAALVESMMVAGQAAGTAATIVVDFEDPVLPEGVLAFMGTSTLGFALDTPGVNPESRVWVVNIDTGASGQYDNYGFNDFLTDPATGKHYGLADDGIYELTGNTDAGIPIDALIDAGSSNYGTHKIKKSTGFYVGCSSEGDLYMKVVTDEETRIYQMTSHSATVETHKIPVSHRQLGTQWNLTLMNADGDDFDVSSIEFEIFPTTSRSK